MASAGAGAQNKFSRPAPEIRVDSDTPLSPRSYFKKSSSEQWELIWEAGPYYERVADALEHAHSYAIFVGWQLDSRLELTTKRRESFKSFLVRLCNEKPDFHIYFLVWDHAYFYVLERELMQEWVWDNVHERIHFIFDNRHPYGGAHHEKMVIVDGETAFVGGIDICDDRWDTPAHLYYDPRRSLNHDREEHYPYHDMSVVVKGEVAAELVEYIGERWRCLSSIPFPERARQALSEGRGRHSLLVSRTKASVDIAHPLIVRETEFLFRDIIRATEKELIIEQQYYWSKVMNDELIGLMRKRAGTGLRVFLVVPAGCRGSAAFRMMGIYQTRLVDQLLEVAKSTGTRLVVGCPYSRSKDKSGHKPIYVHSKVLVADDRYIAIGSANFNNRGFRVDTELTLTLIGETQADRAYVRNQGKQIVAHWGSEAYQQFYEQPLIGIDLQFQPHVYLRPYHEAWDDYLGSAEATLARVLPLPQIFDPMVPLAFFLKSRLAIKNPGRIKRALPFAIAGTLMLSGGAALAVLGLAESAFGLEWRPAPLFWVAGFVFILSNSWFLRVPLLLGSACAGFQFGAKAGGLLVACCVFTAIMLGYGFGRLFPRMAKDYYGKKIPAWLTSELGRRRLPLAVKAVASPRLSLRARSVAQGLFSLPVRWLALTSLAVMPAYVLMAVLGGMLNISSATPSIQLLVSIAFITISTVVAISDFVVRTD